MFSGLRAFTLERCGSRSNITSWDLGFLGGRLGSRVCHPSFLAIFQMLAGFRRHAGPVPPFRLLPTMPPSTFFKAQSSGVVIHHLLLELGMIWALQSEKGSIILLSRLTELFPVAIHRLLSEFGIWKYMGIYHYFS